MTDDTVKKEFDTDADVVAEESPQEEKVTLEREEIQELPKKKKSAKEQFAESTGFNVDDVEETEPQINKADLGLTEPVSEEDTADEAEGRSVYQASAVETVPAQVRDGMQLAGLGRRRQVKQSKEVQPARINKNTVRAFPNKGIGPINKTTFRG